MRGIFANLNMISHDGGRGVFSEGKINLWFLVFPLAGDRLK